MTPDQRRDISNGIWMCYTHGKLIDNDEVRFTVAMLKGWRHFAELRAQLEQDLGRPVEFRPGELSHRGLINHEVEIDNSGPENKIIGDALNDSCVSLIWGTDLVDVVRDALVEIARNARTHGRASRSILRIEPRAILLRDNGAPFNPWRLLEPGCGGGTQAVRQLVKSYGDQFILESRRYDDWNEYILALACDIEDLSAITPCVAVVDYDEEMDLRVELNVIEDCDTVYVLVSEYLVYSDLDDLIDGVELMRSEAQARDGRERSIVFVVKNTSEHVCLALQSRIRRSRIVRAKPPA